MSKELISRAKVISLIDYLGYVNVMNKNDFESNCRMDRIRQAINELPEASEKIAEVQIVRAVINNGQEENIISEKKRHQLSLSDPVRCARFFIRKSCKRGGKRLSKN